MTTDVQGDLPGTLKALAICQTDHPADAASALIAAAASILALRCDPPVIATLIRAAADDALSMTGHLEAVGHA